ncbi:DUF4302 domain-containing protein [Sinomicrobium soli]|uniref:DUF4302 domain-containing protein n=1 Tax=Sinomicrobium sp. N-1-3-6 TaxID=2219864 RepID=UPI000DCBC17B|nr:DUF4302 domain-containing protein [Sinomicrobium sp. N-1-3-6]RAV27609.1 hypothetical protein DN748_17625 [Sinomicrobium sp. N-1-3-6]
MMKTNKLQVKLWYALIIWGIIISCNDDNGADNLFEDNTTERISNAQNELRTTLLSAENGWKMVYFPTDDEFGGFTILMKFNTDGTVDMTSDIDENTDMVTSSYDIDYGATVKLNFATKNHLHKLVDSYYPEALRGTGYKGSGEFLFYGTDEESNVVFRSVRDKEHENITFHRADAADWESAIENGRDTGVRLEGIPSDPVFRGVVITANGEETLYPFSYDQLRRYVSISGTSSEGKITDKSFGVAFAPDKLLLSPSLELEEDTFSEFEWKEAEEKFVSQGNTGITAEIKFLDRPVFITDDYLLIYDMARGGHDRFSYRDDTLAETPYTSEAYKELFNEARDNFAATQGGREIYRFEILFDSETEGRVRYLYYSGSSSFSLYHNFTWEVVDQKILISDNGWDDLNFNPGRETALAPIDQMIFNSEGLFVEQVPETFTYSNQVYTFIAADGATVRFPTYAAVQ